MKIVFHIFFLAILFSLFLWQSIQATLKYLQRTTLASTSIVDEGSILFPSITVCKKYSNGLYKAEIENISVNIEDKLNTIHNRTWGRSEVFFFVSHENMFNVSFPCTTIEGPDTDPGKPCSFPYLRYGKVINGCKFEGGYCPTR